MKQQIVSVVWPSWAFPTAKLAFLSVSLSVTDRRKLRLSWPLACLLPITLVPLRALSRLVLSSSYVLAFLYFVLCLAGLGVGISRPLSLYVSACPSTPYVRTFPQDPPTPFIDSLSYSLAPTPFTAVFVPPLDPHLGRDSMTFLLSMTGLHDDRDDDFYVVIQRRLIIGDFWCGRTI